MSPENVFKRVFEYFIIVNTIDNYNKQCASKLLQSLLLQPNQVNDELQVINNKMNFVLVFYSFDTDGTTSP